MCLLFLLCLRLYLLQNSPLLGLRFKSSAVIGNNQKKNKSSSHHNMSSQGSEEKPGIEMKWEKFGTQPFCASSTQKHHSRPVEGPIQAYKALLHILPIFPPKTFSFTYSEPTSTPPSLLRGFQMHAPLPLGLPARPDLVNVTAPCPARGGQ